MAEGSHEIRSAVESLGRTVSLERLGFALNDESWFAQLRAFRAEARQPKCGAYELLGEAGRGGQGVVYRARQPGTGRLVALKRVSAPGAGSSAFAARIEREAQLAASLNHPSIVAVYGVEPVDGESVLVMEWVDGAPIDRWAAGETTSLRSDDSVDKSGRRSARAILDVFLLICDALQHAHQRGVIHRDLKPSNILVDADDRPHVLDFGVGKLFAPAADATALTRTGQFLGTPAYAAPEQFRGGPRDVDTRTDVYALGAVLHELLTGRAPLTDVGFQARQRGSERVVPAAGARILDRELAAIVSKALSPEKDDRYASVEALAADVRRFLARQPVLAYAGGASYRARKFAQRNVLLCASAGLSGVVILGLAVRATLLSFELSREAQDARDAAAREHAARVQSDELARASRDFGAQAARQAAQNQAATEFLTGLLSTPPKSADGSAAALPTAVLEQAAQLLDGGALRDQPELEQRLRFQIGKAYHDSRQFEPAAVQFEAAVAAARRAFGDDHRATSQSLCYLGVAQRNTNRLDAAVDSLREAIAIADRVLPGGAGASWLAEFADTLQLQGNPDEAAELYSRAARQLTSAGKHADAARSWYALAKMYTKLRRWTDVEAASQLCLAACDAVGSAPNRRRAIALERLGHARLGQRDPAAALAYFRQSLDEFRRINPASPEVSNVSLEVGEAYQCLGLAEDALEPLRESLLLHKPTQPGDVSTRRRQLRLGVSLLAVGDDAAAREMLQFALVDSTDSGAPSAVVEGNRGARVDALIAILRASEFRLDGNPAIVKTFADLLPLIEPSPVGDGGAGASSAPAETLLKEEDQSSEPSAASTQASDEH